MVVRCMYSWSISIEIQRSSVVSCYEAEIKFAHFICFGEELFLVISRSTNYYLTTVGLLQTYSSFNYSKIASSGPWHKF